MSFIKFVILFSCYSRVYPRRISLTGSPSFQFKLMNGSAPWQGRLEVLYQDKWGSICDDEFGVEEGDVVCRHLGHDYSVEVKLRAFFGAGNGDIWMNDFDCLGNETSLSQCRKVPLTEFDTCLNSEDVGLVCNNFTEPFPIRLVDGPFPSQGRVEVYHENQWGTICGHEIDQHDANVICREVGYDYALDFVESGWFVGGTWPYGESNGPVWLDIIRCTGDEMTLAQCKHMHWGAYHRSARYSPPCNHNRDVAVHCGVLSDPFDIRLVDGPSTREGRLEVLYSNTWGSVCNGRFTKRNAAVICRQLGYDYAQDNIYNTQFAESNGPNWLTNIQCDGHEATLSQCRHPPWGEYEYCTPVGIRCLSANKVYISQDSHGISMLSDELIVSYNGSLGYICLTHGKGTYSSWGMNEANVACRHLGYTHALRTYESEDGYSSELFGMYYFHCRGNESKLEECQIALNDVDTTCQGGVASVTCANKHTGFGAGWIALITVTLSCVIILATVITSITIFNRRKQRKQRDAQNV